LYTTIDFFERIGNLLEAGATASAIARYFFYKAPLLISRVIGFAALFSTLFCLGSLARSHEITALRASGISVGRIGWPLLMIGILLCGGTFVWNETLVPVFTRNSQNIYKAEIRNRQQKSVLGTHDLWIRGDGSFINIDSFDARSTTIENVTIFLLNRDFSLRALTEIPKAEWINDRWQTSGATEWVFVSEGKAAQQKEVTALPITETPEDLKLLARDAEEFSFFELQRQIADMRTRGIDTTAYEVDLHTKLALPFIAPLMVFLAIPFALKRRLSGSLSLSFGVTMVIAFSYWVLVAFCISLGHSGALPSWVSAWIPNIVFAMTAAFFFTAEE
jgi:lipopolysaccharide export system permease protein